MEEYQVHVGYIVKLAAAQFSNAQRNQRDSPAKPPPDILLRIEGPPAGLRRKDLQSNLEGYRRQIAQLPGGLGQLRIVEQVSCAYPQKMKLLEAAKYPEQVVEGLRRCS